MVNIIILSRHLFVVECLPVFSRLMLAAQTAMSLKGVAKLVVGLGNGIGKTASFAGNVKNQGRFSTDPERTNHVY